MNATKRRDLRPHIPHLSCPSVPSSFLFALSLAGRTAYAYVTRLTRLHVFCVHSTIVCRSRRSSCSHTAWSRTRGRDVSMKEAAAILFHKLAMVITHIHLLCTKKSYVDVEGCTGTQVVLSRSSSKTAWLRAYAYYFISLPCLGARWSYRLLYHVHKRNSSIYIYLILNLKPK